MFITSLFLPLVMSFEVPLSSREVLLVNKPHGYVYRQISAAPAPNNEKKNALQFSYFNNVGNKTFSFRIYIYNDPDNQVSDDANARAFLHQYCAQYEKGSIEGRVIIKAKRSRESKPVLFCTFTDASLASKTQLRPGQYKHVSLALVRKKGYVFLSVAFSNQVSGRLYKRFLRTLASLYIQNRVN